MPGNKVRRFTELRYGNSEDNETIERAYISSEEHTINHILRNLIRNVEFIAILPDVLPLNADSDVDSELSRALQEHLVLEQRLEMLKDHKPESDEKNDDAHVEIKIRSSLRNLLRLLKDRSLLLSVWKKELGKEIGKCERALINELNILGGLKPQPFMAALKPVSSDLKEGALQDFPATMEEVTAKISQKHQEIETLQSALQKKTEEKNRLEEQLQLTIEESDTKQIKIQQEVDQTSTELNDVMYNNFDEEAALRLKIKRVDAVTESLIEDFDEEIETLQGSYEKVAKEFEQEVKEVKKLEMLYSELDLEYRYILEKRRLAEEKKEKEAKEVVLKKDAALLIQAWWRGYCVRKALKEREKKGKGKKGKKGKTAKKQKKAGKGKKAKS